ncbi:MAG: glycine cleavage system aminomethyltransferase GcvT [Geminicoccaceae bacterium]
MTSNNGSTEASMHTPLFDLHVELGGKMVDFAGWTMPVQYTAGIMAEHRQCREQAALFDVSHMGQVELRGDAVAAKMEQLVPSSITTLASGKARYTVLTNDDGGILDDLIISNAGDHLFVVVNAAMRDQDIPHMRRHLQGVDLVEIADRALVALQGPAASAVLATLAPASADLRFLETATMAIAGADCRVSRLGYTGEDGFEISMPASAAVDLSRRLLEDERVAPAGLGARDSLRLEAGLCLYGNDIDATTSPVEAQLNWIIQKRRREAGDFPGAKRILAELAEGPARKLVGIRPDGRAPAREGTDICDAVGNVIGKITSGGFGPTVNGPVSMGYVQTDHAEPETKIDLMVRGKARPGKIVALPFTPHHYLR